MRPNLSGVSRVMGRIEEIERKIRPQKDKKARDFPGFFLSRAVRHV